MRKFLQWAFIFPAICVAGEAAADETVFRFQKAAGEGESELYEVKVDFASETGSLCYLHTFDADRLVTTEMRERLWDGKDYSTEIDIHAQKTTICGRFDLYQFGRFYHGPVSDFSRSTEYRMVFIGNMNKDGMKGKLHTFAILDAGSTGEIRYIDVVDVEVPATVK